MTDDTYSLPELADLAGVSPRTVRYYVANGLLPSPGLGSGARYADEHLHRLRLIRQWQRAHQPLAQIRSRLAALSGEEVRVLLEQPTAEPGTALDYVRGVLGSTRPTAERQGTTVGQAASHLRIAMNPGATPALMMSDGPGPGLGEPSGALAERSQWDRIALTPDIELHVRRPLDRITNRRVERLLAIARQLLEEDQP
jgi:DNA-binding transcriptional MerR regulator